MFLLKVLSLNHMFVANCTQHMFVTNLVAKYFTKLGMRSFNGRSLHSVGELQNPYEQAISIIGKTLAAFDEDNLIPCFGFGDGILQFIL